ncbi:MAG TPA: ATP-binding cassette domain-containing protein [Deltaproteobacteria bacterium]|nr:ATP-binding cassette domain-containing protein [Deltaproteobacteria bacterium]
MNPTPPLLEVKNITKHFDISGGFLEKLSLENMRPVLKKTVVHALNDVSFSIIAGETFSIVGESGCGKSTLGRAVLGLYPPSSGQIYYYGTRIDVLNAREMLPYRRKMQMVFQDPYASLNPRMKVEQTLMEPVLFHNPAITMLEARDLVSEIMEQVGVDPLWASRYPHEFSGGQRQRISIARALMVEPEFIVADEPISALDVSIQAQILNLFMEAQETRGLTYLFITHDMSVVKHISTRVAVMYLGTICELARTEALFTRPRHPYTQALLSAIPVLGTKKARHIKLKGEVPTPIDLPKGCVFHKRCPHVFARCREEVPLLAEYDSGRLLACHGVEEGRI